MEDTNYANKFASFYEEHADTYGDDIELALSDFQGFEGLSDDFAFFDTVKSVASNVGSGLKTAASVAGGVAKKVATTTGTVMKKASDITGVTNLAKHAKRAAYGAAIGGTVNAVRGKSVVKGMGAGAAVGTVGGALADKAGSMYKSVRDKFSDDDYSNVLSDEESINFIEFYSEMEDIYGENMDEAFSDYIQLHSDEYSLESSANKFVSKVGDKAKLIAGRASGSVKVGIGRGKEAYKAGMGLNRSVKLGLKYGSRVARGE